MSKWTEVCVPGSSEGNVPTSHPRLRSALVAIKSVPEAKKALQALTDAGFDELTLVTILYYYCGGTEDEALARLRAARKFRDQLDRISSQLIQDADWVERLVEQCEEHGVRIYGPGVKELSPTMMRVADMLSTVALAYKKGLKNVRMGRKGKANISAGRSAYLVYLVHLISGGEPRARHYAQLARLVAAVRRDSNQNYIKIADALRQAVARFKERAPLQTWMLADEAQEEFEISGKGPLSSSRM
jgi:hypothetical protein